MPHERLHQWQEHRLHRKVVPVSIERRSEDENLPFADAPFGQRDTAVVEAREHRVVRGR
jgi:hypothetical protein